MILRIYLASQLKHNSRMEKYEPKHPIIENTILGFFWIVVMVGAILCLSHTLSSTETPSQMLVVFGSLGLIGHAGIYIYEAVVLRKDRLVLIFDAVSAAILIAAAIVLMVNPQAVASTLTSTLLVIGLHAGRCIFRIVSKRTKFSIALNVLLFLCFGFGFLAAVSMAAESEASPLMALSFVEMTMAFFGVVALAFRRMRMNVLLNIIRKTYAAEIAAGLLTLIIAFSIAFYYLDSAFPQYGDALWYTFAVVTTIGFGDFAATSLVTRILSVVLGIYGIIFVAVITSIVVNFYTETKNEAAADKKEAELKKEDEGLLEDTPKKEE